MPFLTFFEIYFFIAPQTLIYNYLQNETVALRIDTASFLLIQ